MRTPQDRSPQGAESAAGSSGSAPARPQGLGKIVRVWWRCNCGYRVPVSGPERTDFMKYRPVHCGNCGNRGQFQKEAA